jgi:hypothetical protein
MEVLSGYGLETRVFDELSYKLCGGFYSFSVDMANSR